MMNAITDTTAAKETPGRVSQGIEMLKSETYIQSYRLQKQAFFSGAIKQTEKKQLFGLTSVGTGWRVTHNVASILAYWISD
jgi:hypothetical protein